MVDQKSVGGWYAITVHTTMESQACYFEIAKVLRVALSNEVILYHTTLDKSYSHTASTQPSEATGQSLASTITSII